MMIFSPGRTRERNNAMTREELSKYQDEMEALWKEALKRREEGRQAEYEELEKVVARMDEIQWTESRRYR